MSLDDILRDDYGCRQETIQEVVRWVSLLDDQGKRIFYHRLAGQSSRAIALQMGADLPVVAVGIGFQRQHRNCLQYAFQLRRKPGRAAR